MPEVAVSDMTEKQMLQWLMASNQRIETQMSDLSARVASLQEAVSGVGTRVQTIQDDLLADVQRAQEALDAAQADDADDAATIANLQEALAASQAASQEAADGIASAVGDLNQIGTGGEASGTPDDPNAPHPDNTLPNPDDQPHPDQTLPGDLPSQ